MNRVRRGAVSIWLISLALLGAGVDCTCTDGEDGRYCQSVELRAAALEPFIEPCSSVPPCPSFGPDSWFYCQSGPSAKGCKKSGPFSEERCSSQCSFSPATSKYAFLHTYKASVKGEPISNPRDVPFFHVPAGPVLQICLESCSGSRGYNERSSLVADNLATTPHLYEVTEVGVPISIWSTTWSRVRDLPVQQDVYVPRQNKPAICFIPDYYGPGYTERDKICASGAAYPLTPCTRQCYDNSNNRLDLVAGDIVALVLDVEGQAGDRAYVDYVVSVYSGPRASAAS